MKNRVVSVGACDRTFISTNDKTITQDVSLGGRSYTIQKFLQRFVAVHYPRYMKSKRLPLR